jgi:hypothetical protein
MLETRAGKEVRSLVVIENGLAHRWTPLAMLNARANGALLVPLFPVQRKEAFAIKALVKFCEAMCEWMVDDEETRLAANDFLREAQVVRAFLSELEEHEHGADHN